jgi:prefoldin subunit 5
MEEKIKNILTDYKSLPNKDLEYALETLNEDFEKTKGLIIKLTHHLDNLEKNYNNIIEEYKNRTKK